ncbi:MAG: hypothetical protein A2283_00795 [Lentisphaerae bacterium RIFOXYA12_FULL_48_11]|nr:MAG: hypothetical protein A2283_00795 [Lentisphaerae bacterium RIFOXYA12_FULL_48_11]
MHIDSIVVGEFQVNCFILWENSPNALVVDPGDNPERISNFLKQNGLIPSAYLFTHGHCDHISALPILCREFPAPIAMHKSDLEWAFTKENDFPPYYKATDRPSVESRELKDNAYYLDAGLNYKVLHTPGHTPGAVCLYFYENSVLLTGDTLFAGSVGRSDLPGGNSRKLQRSIDFLATLPDDTRVYAGHGQCSTILQEKKTNYFMRFSNKIE